MRKKIIVKCKNVELPQHLVQPQSRSLTGNITDAQKFHNFSFWRRKKRHFPQTRFHARMVTKIISYSNLINEQKPFLYSTAVSVLVWISVFFFERRVSSTIMPIRLFLQEEVLCFFMSHPRLRKIYSWLFSCLFNLTETDPYPNTIDCLGLHSCVCRLSLCPSSRKNCLSMLISFRSVQRFSRKSVTDRLKQLVSNL